MSFVRGINNRIERWLDRRSLHAPSARSERPPGGGVPCTVAHALERAAREAHRLDDDARLKHVLAPRGVAADGAARRWEFVFDLPQRRAKLLAQWYLDGDSQFGRFGRECFDAEVRLFPPADSPLAQGIAEGRLAYSQATAAWRGERRRTPDLPLAFRDSDTVIADLERQGLRPGDGSFVMRNALGSRGENIWLVQLGEANYHHRFS